MHRVLVIGALMAIAVRGVLPSGHVAASLASASALGLALVHLTLAFRCELNRVRSELA